MVSAFVAACLYLSLSHTARRRRRHERSLVQYNHILDMRVCCIHSPCCCCVPGLQHLACSVNCALSIAPTTFICTWSSLISVITLSTPSSPPFTLLATPARSIARPRLEPAKVSATESSHKQERAGAASATSSITVHQLGRDGGEERIECTTLSTAARTLREWPVAAPQHSPHTLPPHLPITCPSHTKQRYTLRVRATAAALQRQLPLNLSLRSRSSHICLLSPCRSSNSDHVRCV